MSTIREQVDRLVAIKNRIRTNLVAQGVTVPADAMLDAMAEQVLSVAGDDGVSCTHSWDGTTLTVTSASGTSSADLKGATGEVDYSRLNDYAKKASRTNLMHNGNEVTFVPDAYSGQVYFNYGTESGKRNGDITHYLFCNGKGGTSGVSIVAANFDGTAARAYRDGSGNFIEEFYAQADDLHSVAMSGNYEELHNKPTNVSSFANDAGYQTAEQVSAATSGYLPLSGGSMTGALDFSDSTQVLDFGTTGYFRGKTASGNRFDMFSLVNSTTLNVGGTYPALALKGKNARPTYNSKDVALLEDVSPKAVPVTATSTDGISYTATADFLTATSLSELKGVTIVIIPDKQSASGGNVTLNVNGLGAKGIKRNDGMYTHDWWSFSNTDWMRAGYPVPLMFDGTYWMVLNREKVYASDLQGTVPVNKGGTGVTSHADTTYTTARYRASALVSSETAPTTNGVINWTYE